MPSIKFLSVSFAALALSACSHVAPRYGISANNVEAIRSAASNPVQKISVAPFSTFEAGLSSISCRAAGPVSPPDNLTYEKFIQDAFTSELKLAGVYSAEAENKLQGRLDYITFNSNIGAGKWQIEMTLTGKAGQPFKVNTVYPFSTNFVADVACNQVATALPAAVQELVGQAVAHPSFQALLNGK